MEYVLNILWSLLELVFFYFFWGCFLHTKRTTKEQLKAIATAWFAGLVYLFLIPDEMIKQGLTYSMLFLVSVYLYRGVWYLHLILVLVGCLFNGLMDAIILYSITAILEISYAEFVWMKLFYSVAVTISKLVSILIAWSMRRVKNTPNNDEIQRKWLLLMLLFPVVSMIMLGVVFVGFQDEQDLSIGAVIFSLVLAAANIAIMYLIGIMEKNTKELQENALLHQQMDIQTDSIMALERSYRNQRQATHEYKNQLQTIHDLLENGKTTEAKSYVQQLQGMQTTRIFTVNSHHPIIDAVLNHKYQTAKDHDIDFQIQVNDLSEINIRTDELVVLFSNLLDNAIEACDRVNKFREIQCSILFDGTLFLSVRNTSNPVTIIADTIPTCKFPKEEHGFGLARIQLILKQLGAEYTFAYDKGWFHFVTEIPMNQNSNT